MSLESWEVFSEIGFWLVILGVVGESVELLEKFGVLPRTLKNWAPRLELIFWMILVVGLAMELIGSHNARIISSRQNAVLEKEAADASLEAGRLKALVSWRDIPDDKRVEFKAAVKDFPKGKVIVESLASDAEGTNFAKQIADMLTQAGYAVSENLSSMTFFGTLPIGVKLRVKSREQTPIFAAGLQHALRDIGIDAPATVGGPEVDVDLLVITVGAKP